MTAAAGFWWWEVCLAKQAWHLLGPSIAVIKLTIYAQSFQILKPGTKKPLIFRGTDSKRLVEHVQLY